MSRVRFLPVFLLLLAPAPAGRRDCGLVPGERYWFLRGGGLVGNDVYVEDASDCDIPVGVILSVQWNEAPPKSRIVVHPSCDPPAGEEAALSRMEKQAREFLHQSGFTDSNIAVERGECANPKHVDVVIE